MQLVQEFRDFRFKHHSVAGDRGPQRRGNVTRRRRALLEQLPYEAADSIEAFLRATASPGGGLA